MKTPENEELRPNPWKCRPENNGQNKLCNTNHSKLYRFIKVNTFNSLDVRVNDYTIFDS